MRALLLLVAASPVVWAAQSSYAPADRVWTVSNATFTATFQLTPEGYFLAQRLSDSKTGDDWAASASSPSSIIRFQVNEDWFDAQTNFTLVDHHPETISPAGARHVIILRDELGRGDVTVTLEAYDSFPVLRYSVRFTNSKPEPVQIKFAN